MGFDETEIPHYVLSVTFDEECKAQITQHEVPVYTKYIRLEGTFENIRQKLIQLKSEKCTALIDIHINDAILGMDIRRELADITNGADFEVVRFRIVNNINDSQIMIEGTDKDLSDFSERDIFKALLEKNEMTQKEDELMPLFLQLLNEVTDKIETKGLSDAN